jgi:hypothetical protein
VKNTSQISQTSQLDKNRAFKTAVFRKQDGDPMQGEECTISLIIRTIGAERGRAARGRPALI